MSVPMMRERGPGMLLAMLLVLVSLGVLPGSGLCLPEPMQPARMVNDFSRMFSAGEQERLERQVRDYEARSGVQIYIVTVNSLEGEPALRYATRLGNAWGVGQEGKDNGVVLLIKPKTADSRGEVALALGTGVEKVLGSKAAQRIIDNSLLPLFRKGLFAEGAQQVAHTVELLLDERMGQGQAPPASTKQAESAPQPPARAPSRYDEVPRPDASRDSYARETRPLPDDRNSSYEGSRSSFPGISGMSPEMLALLTGAGLFFLFLGILVVTGHGKLAGKILLGLIAVIGVVFSLATIFGGGSRSRSRSSSSYDDSFSSRDDDSFSGGGGGSFSGGGGSGSFGGGSFSGGGASGSW